MIGAGDRVLNSFRGGTLQKRLKVLSEGMADSIADPFY